MAMAVFALIFFIVIQLLCCLKGKRKLVKALPLLTGLLLIGAFFALMMWSFSLPSPTDMVEFKRQDDQSVYFILGFCTSCLAVGGSILGWLVYGVILLVRGRQNKTPPMPSYEDIISIMYDKGLARCDEVAKVIYNAERTRRFVVLKSENGYYTYVYEELHPFDEEEWMYVCTTEGALPAVWEPHDPGKGKSLFAREEDLMKELMLSPEYITYFAEQ